MAWGKNQKSGVGRIKFETPIRCSRGGEQQAVGSLRLGFKRKVRAADTNLDAVSIEMMFTATGWTRASSAAVEPSPSQGHEGQKILRGKYFCKL